MAAAYLPKIRERINGRELGPCEPGACKHRDCAEIHQTAGATCVHCGEPIGYGVRYFGSCTGKRGIGYAHMECEYKAAEGGAS